MAFIPRVRRQASRRLTQSQKIVLKKLRHGEQRWQRALASSVAQRTTYNLATSEGDGEAAAVADYGYDARVQMMQVLESVRTVLRDARVEFVELPRLQVYRPILVIRQADVQRAVGALSELPADSGWQVRAFGLHRQRLRAKRVRSAPDDVRRVTVRQRVMAHNGREMSTYREMVSIEPWEELGFGEPRVDGGTHAEGTLHRLLKSPQTYIDYLMPAQWRTAVDTHDGHVRLDASHLYAVPGPIDLVYTWVDGDDPVWASRKQNALRGFDSTAINETAVTDSRFESRDELKYSLRSIEYYASWINRIYIVTDGQIPSWLDTEHPKVRVVDHRDIFRDTSVLPVFNSHAIESQLHHIPGLSERYIYMNDDLMFMRPTNPDLFYTGNRMSKFFPSRASLDVGERSSRDLPVLSAAKRGREFMVGRFGRTVTNKFKHTPHAQLKSVLTAMEEENPALFDSVSTSRFRHPDDYSIPSALYHYYAYAIGKAVTGSIRYAYMDIAREDARLYLDRLLRRRDLDVMCLNDTNLPEERREEMSALLRDFFESRFPIVSSFERSE